jgi:co-chaperonin GroES (HSP10)
MTALIAKKSNERGGLSRVRSLYPVELKQFTAEEQSAIDNYFPNINPGIIPNGNRILIQMRAPKQKSDGGIYLPDNMSTSQLYEEQIGRVVAIGSSAFHSQTTMTPWPEGEPFAVGDFVRVPKFGAERIWQKDEALFEIVRDFDVIGVVLCNPLDFKGYV